MSYKKINNLTGWAVFAIATIVYLMTMEPQGSLWDCGEFAGTAARMGVPHPPGAPLFIVVGRIFAIIGNALGMGEAGGVALMSVLSSSFTILFLFWTITHFARKIKIRQSGALVALAEGAITQNDYNSINSRLSASSILEIMAAGVVGALAYTFSDSFWYSAVESEVYAMSSLCTAVVFWAALKWEDHPENNAEATQDGRNRADKWMILIFFIMGMSIGVHLLNILTIPPIILLYYFKRYKKSNSGIIIALLISIGILGFVQKFVGQWSIDIAFHFDKFFVNGLNMPVLSGFIFFFIILGILFYIMLLIADGKIKLKSNSFLVQFIAGIVVIILWRYVFFNLKDLDQNYNIKTFLYSVLYGLVYWFLYYLQNHGGLLRLITWCLIFVFIGMSTYLTTMIRAAANPGIDMYNVDNPYALKGYLSREQYGDFPLLYGQTYEANPNGGEKTGKKYVLRKDDNGKLKYIEAGYNMEQKWNSEDMMFLPRIWYGNEENRKQFYTNWLNPKKEVIDRADNSVYDIFDNAQDAENKADELNRKQGQARYIARDHLTQKENMNWLFSYQINWMYLRYFMWNFAGKQNDIQGFSSKRDGNWISGISWLDNMRLGDQSAMPDSLKNNKANNKLYFLPLILGIIGLIYQWRNNKEDGMITTLLFLMTGLAIVGYLNQYGLQPRERDYAYVGSFYAFAIWIGLGVMQVRDWFAKITKGMLPGILAGAICFAAVPLLMANQEWDDHDRSKKLLAKDLARDYLNSCPKNAILFTVGDNDTYPLWFAQEILGIRKDIRVVNTSLLGIDWYLDQLKYKVNESDLFKMVWDSKDYEGTNMDGVYEYAKYDKSPQTLNNTYSLDEFLKKCLTLKVNNPDYGIENQPGYPGKNYFLNIDINNASKIFNLQAGDSLAGKIDLSIAQGKNVLNKGDLGILNILAANINDRPICFTDNYGAELGFRPFLRKEGMVYRFIPSNKFKDVELETSYKKMMDDKEFGFGNAKAKGVYYDEENRRHLESIRTTYAQYAIDLAQVGKIEEAQKILNRIHTEMPKHSLPYGSPSRQESINNTSLLMVQAAYMAKDSILGKEIYNDVSKDIDQQFKYYYVLSHPKEDPSKANVESFKKDMLEFYNFSQRGGVSQADISRYRQLEAKIVNNKLSGFTLSDALANTRNAAFLERLKTDFIDPKPQLPVTPTTNLPVQPTAQKVR